jgi:threonine dehydrogenase-like Zn-dependent dehydrogenase
VALVGSRCGPFVPAVELLASGRIDVAPLIQARYPLADGVRAFDHAARPGTLKVLVDPTV